MKPQASCCQELRIIPIPLDDEIKAGESVTDKILGGMKDQNLAFIAGDILVVKHKIVSKAEGQIVDLAKIRPSAASRAWARRFKLDARVTELAMSQSRRVVRRKRGVLITNSVDRKSTRLNSSYVESSYAVFCLKKKKGRRFYRVRRR